MFYQYRNARLPMAYRTLNQWLRRQLPDWMKVGWRAEKREIVALFRDLTCAESARLTRLNWLLGVTLSVYLPTPIEIDRGVRLAKETIAELIEDGRL